MKNVLIYMFTAIVFLASLVLFLPKENLYYLALQQLNIYKVNIISDNIKDKMYCLDIKNSLVKYQDIDIASVKDININSYLIVTHLKIKNLKVAKTFKQFIPYNLKYIDISYSLLDPLAINIYLSKQFKIPSKNMIKNLTKTKSGYRYEF